MKKFFKFTGFAIGGVLLFLVLSYCMMWFLVARNMQAYIDFFWAGLPDRKDIVIVGDKPEVSGFPLPPEFRFSGVVTFEDGLALNIPDLLFSGFPLSGLTVYIEAPHGMTISPPNASWTGTQIDFAAINLTLPMQPPMQAEYTQIKKWQEKDDPLLINGFDIKADNLRIRGRGTLGVDKNLQPDLRIESRVDGIETLLDKLSKNENVGKKSLEMSRNFLNMFSKKDPETGLSYFETGFYIQNGGVFIGPARMYSLQEIVWPGTPSAEYLSRKKPD